MSDEWSDIIRATKQDAFADGMQAERKRIIKLLKSESDNCAQAGLWANGSELRGQLQQLHLGLKAAISLIKDEANDGTN